MGMVVASRVGVLSFVMLAVGCIAAASGTSSGVIVYDNSPLSTRIEALTSAHDRNETSSTNELPGGLENASEIAQLITLRGTDRYATKIELWLGMSTSETVGRSAVLDATVRLFTVSGNTEQVCPIG